MKIRLSLLFILSIVFVFSSHALDKDSPSSSISTNKPSVCHVDFIKKIQLKDADISVMGGCEKGDVLSIYMGGVNHRPEWFIATVSRLCEVGTIALSNGTNQNIATCRYRGEILNIK